MSCQPQTITSGRMRERGGGREGERERGGRGRERERGGRGGRKRLIYL